MEFERILTDKEVAPVTMTRVMGAMTDLGIKYRVDENDDNEMWASWPGYIVHIVWDGPFEPTMQFMARIWGEMDKRQLPEFQRWIEGFNREHCQPTFRYRFMGKRLSVHIDNFLSLKGGMSDAQLRENFDTIFKGIQAAARAAALELPDLTQPEPGFLVNFGEEELELTLPVTNSRIERTLEVLEAEDIFEHCTGDITFRSNGIHHMCGLYDEGKWLRVATNIGEPLSADRSGPLMDLVNEFNSIDETRFVVLPDGDGLQLRCENNTFISIGMTAAQLGEALRDAVWGQNELYGESLRRIQAMEKATSS